MENFNEETEDVKKNQMEILELKIVLNKKFSGWAQQQNKQRKNQ